MCGWFALKPVLIVSFIYPFPVNSGGSRDIFERIKILHQAGYSVDLVATPRCMPNEEDVAALSVFVNRMWIIPRTRHIGALLSRKPFHYETRLDLKTIHLEGNYFAVILESEFVGGILENPALSAQNVILRVHNNEAALHLSLARDAAGPVERMLFLAESLRFRHYTPHVMSLCRQLWYISEVEMRAASKGAFAEKSRYLPVIVDDRNFRVPDLASSHVFYAGALSVPINQRGLIWFLTHVHPHLLEVPGYCFVLAGKTGNADMRRLLRIVKSCQKVTYCPNVSDLSSLYSSSAVFINPIQRGAGVKIKTIDAAMEGLPVVTTSVGAEGTGFLHGIHAWIADTPEEFAEGIRYVLRDKAGAAALVSASQGLLREKNGVGKLICLMEALA
jgi:glycosyltransferase involved in cell wall biosynthesis